MVYSYTVSISIPDQDDYNSFLEKLICEVCPLFGISKDDLSGKSRVENIRYARWMCWEILVAKENMTLVNVAKLFGYDHSSVVHALDTLPNVLEDKKHIKTIYDAVLSRMGVDMDVIRQMRRRREKNARPMFVSNKRVQDKMRKYLQAGSC
jgi:hypothetical protein